MSYINSTPKYMNGNFFAEINEKVTKIGLFSEKNSIK